MNTSALAVPFQLIREANAAEEPSLANIPLQTTHVIPPSVPLGSSQSDASVNVNGNVQMHEETLWQQYFERDWTMWGTQ